MKLLGCTLPMGIGLLAALLVGCATPGANLPRHSEHSSEIYDTRADGKKQLAAALKEGRQTGKRILLDLGANWCSDSRATYHLLKSDPAIREEIRQHFVLVLVDVNEQDGEPRNRKLVKAFNDPLSRGIPVLLI